MYYFVNESIVELNSGIEHAEFDRLRLFKHMGTQAKIVLRNWNRNANRNILAEHQDPHDFIGMWDYLQEALDVPRKIVHLDDLNFPKSYLWHRENDFADIYDGDWKIATVRFRGGEVGVVDYVQYLDSFGNTSRIDFYDYRGFRSLTQFYDRNDKVSTEEMYTPDGKRVYESYYRHDEKGNVVNSQLKVIDFHGQDLEFGGLDEMFRWFLDMLNEQDGGDSTFISDRRFGLDWSVANMQSKAHKYIMFHNTHMMDPLDQVHSELNNAYEIPLVTSPEKLDGIIVLTPQQKKDVIERWAPKTKVLVIPPAIVFDEQLNLPHLPYSMRSPHDIIAVARRYPEKRLDHLIKAVNIVRRDVPDVTLNIHGYGDGKTNLELDELIKTLGLQDTVFTHDYTDNLNAVYNRAAVSASSSITEGLPLALVESEAHGLPIVAYDINYGPRDIITDGANGYLVPQGDIEALAERLKKVLTLSAEDWTKMSDAAYKAAKDDFSEASLWKKWGQVVQ